MSQVIRQTSVREEKDDENVISAQAKPGSIAARIVYIVLGIITTLLALRFLLVFLGANPGNAFANFIYSFSNPLVSPFFGLFNYNVTLGQARFEFETLIAIIVYSLVGWLIIRLATLNRSNSGI